MERLIFHVDVNSAFLSWEAVRRVQKGEPDIRLIPSAIGGDPAQRTGVIVAKSIPAKKLGVKTGEPVASALKKCPTLWLARPDFRLYERNSRAFINICRTYTPVVEKFSIDECFLDMSGMGRLYPDPEKAAHQLKDEIFRTLGFTVNVGISCNKILAKMASDFEKPDRVHTLYADEIEKKLWPLPVRSLFTVGKSTARKLQEAGIHTIGALAQQDLFAVQALVGNKLGKQLHRFANGQDDTPVAEEPEEAKGYSISTTLNENITTEEEGCQLLLMLADSVAARMRSDGAKAGCIGVTIRSHDFQNRSHQRRLEAPTDITNEIVDVSRQLFRELWNRRTPLRLLGISLTQTVRAGYEQATLFPDERKEKERRADQVVDAIRSRFGSDIIVRGSIYHSQMEVGKKYRAQLENHEAEQQKEKGL